MRPLNMIICVKPVPDSRYWDKLTLDPKTKTLRREGIPVVISPLDKNAIEEALRIKEARGGGKVSVISMGPPNTTEVLAMAYALGVDEAILLSDRAFAGADTLATAAALGTGIKKLGSFDLIMFGNESLDGSTGQVGPQVAEFLGIPSMTRVEKIDFVSDDTIHARSRIEGGYMVTEIKLPAALAVTKDINEVRLMPVFGALWATEKQTKVLSAADVAANKEQIGTPGSPTWVSDVTSIDMRRKGTVIKGEPAEIARQLVEKLRAAGVLPEL
jgi:electron transfer flavoprotein beta subunit